MQRAQLGQLQTSQLNSIAGQVANSLKAAAEAAARQQQQQANLVNCFDNAANLMSQQQQQPHQQETVSLEQTLAPRVAPVIQQQLDPTVIQTELQVAQQQQACNGQTNILVFQQKPVPKQQQQHPQPSSTSNVPVLVSFLKIQFR